MKIVMYALAALLLFGMASCNLPINPASSVETATASPEPAPDQITSRTYAVRQTIELINDGPGAASRVVLWVAMVQTIAPYQQVTETVISPEGYSTVTDRHGNLYAQVELTDIPAGETRLVELAYRVVVNKIRITPGDCTGDVPQQDLDPEPFLDSDDPDIQALSVSLQQGAGDLCQAARAFYDYLGDEFSYSQYMPADLGAAKALERGQGDCTEFTDLFISLSRAAGLPARFLEGVTCCTDTGYQAGENKHDWAEVYLPGSGWVPVDATWGRFPNKRELYFAAMTPDHIIVTRGRNLDTLGGYHYYYYRYYWDDEATSISSNETWSVLAADQ